MLSGKLDESEIRHGSNEIRIEGIFDLSSRTDLVRFINEQGVEVEDGALIFSVSQKRGGRVVIRINGTTIQRGIAREIGLKLVEIHGQSQHLSLLNPSSHLDFLDSYAGTSSQRQEFGNLARIISSTIREIGEISARQIDLARRKDLLSFQYQEIERAALIEGEDVGLEEEKRVLTSAEKLRILAIEVTEVLDGEDTEASAINCLSKAASVLGKLTAIDDRLKSQADVVRDALFGASEAARDLRAYISRIDGDPMRLEEVEIRIGFIRDLKRKYGNSISEILAFAERSYQELNAFTDLDDRKNSLLRETQVNKVNLALMAIDLTRKRQAAAIRLEDAINAELMELGMERARFRVAIGEDPANNGLVLPNGCVVNYDMTGADKVEFLTSTNPGEPFQALEKIASTGELSRFTLAVKTALASVDKIPSLIFDEIDIGVGGRSGDIIGRKLSKIALSHQVICITHLPQIACYGAHHFTIRKAFDGERSTSILSELSGGELVTELAFMLSGHESRAATESARELLAKVASYTLILKEPH